MGIAPEWIVLCAGVMGGVLANWLIYAVAYNQRPIGPWRPPHPDAPPRHPVDRIPILGWILLRRESGIHGSGFWVRPMLIEIGFPLFLVWLYRFETSGGLVGFGGPGLVAANRDWFHWIFGAHAVLSLLLVAATFIDFDEQSIPDWITLPGTLLGLVAASVTPRIFLPNRGNALGAPLEPLLLTSPNGWSESLDGIKGLWIGLAIIAGWCFALADRRVILRRGWKKAWVYFFARIARDRFWRIIVVISILLAIYTSLVWSRGGASWQGLLTALMGLAIGGGFIWGVRLFAGWAMGMEAMGFGDVILLGMIGVYLGWQGALLTFAVAPMVAIGLALVYFLVTGDNRLAFGPYLSVGAIVVICGWKRIWNGPAAFSEYFAWPWMLAIVLGVALVAMALLLRILRMGRE